MSQYEPWFMQVEPPTDEVDDTPEPIQDYPQGSPF